MRQRLTNRKTELERADLAAEQRRNNVSCRLWFRAKLERGIEPGLMMRQQVVEPAMKSCDKS